MTQTREALGDVLVPPPSETADTFPVLDSLRAVGAVCVVTTHVSFWAGDYTRHGTVGTVLARLDVGVAIFFVLSGFLLSRAWLVRAADGRAAPPVTPYFWKRLLRIAPVYVIAVTAALTFIHANRGIGAAHWATTLLMLDAFRDDGFPAGATQMWSLAVEVCFYLVLPLVMLALVGRHRRLDPRRVLVGLAVLTAFSVWWHLQGAALVGRGRPLQALPAYLGWFSAGILLALVQVRVTRGDRSRPVRAVLTLGRQPGSCWALAAAILLVAATPLAGPSTLASPTPAESLTKNLLYLAVGALVVTSGIFADPTGAYARWMSHPLLRRLGWISYGIFCLHLPLLHFTMWATGWPLFGGRGLGIWVITMTLSLIAAELAYRLVERPALRLKRLVRHSDRHEVADHTTADSGTSTT